MFILKIIQKITILIIVLCILSIKINSFPIMCQNSQTWIRQIKEITDNRTQFVRTKLGFSMLVDKKDEAISIFIKNYGIWQPVLINLIKHIVKPDDKVLNIGSQLGMQALAMGKIIGQKGHLYVFQPYTFSYRLMRKSIFLNNLQNIVTTYNVGGSDKFQIGTIRVSYGNTGASRINNLQNYNERRIKQKTTSNYAFQQQRVILARADQVLDQNVQLDFVLIDVQGMQIQAIAGMKNIIQRSPNLIIFSEWQFGLYQNQKSKQKFEMVVNYLFEKGYKIYQIVKVFNQQCKMPVFKQLRTIQSLIIQGDADVIMIPKGKQLPNY